ncbi:MAG TPA: pseudomurein-binding repeat-containing protein [Methanobacterium sp.]|nr:pseudomurein-binding repeat-containing protein [Methanobacterium sp.]
MINKKVIYTVLILLCLTLTLNTVSASTNTTDNATTVQDKTTTSQNNNVDSTSGDKATSTNYAAGSPKTINVLIYNGNGASYNCVNGMKTSYSSANSNNLLQGVSFNYATSTILTSSILSGYDVLVMPGGTGGKIYLNDISKSMIQNFVKNGGGFVGICAGAFAGAQHVDGWYDGWGVAPHVWAKAPYYEGNLSVSITSAGSQILNRSGTMTLAYFNGPTMYLKGGGTTFATYADSKTGYKGYAAIVGDYFGNGRSVLIGPHPELTPQMPDIIASLTAWVTNTAINPTPDPTPTTSLTPNQIADAANRVKIFYETKKRMPNFVSTPAGNINMPKFLNLLVSATTQLNSGSIAAIKVINVNNPTRPSGSIKKGNIQKSEFLNIANRIKSFISTNSRAPNFVSTSLGNLSYNSAIYMFSKVMAFYSTNKRLPNFVSM